MKEIARLSYEDVDGMDDVSLREWLESVTEDEDVHEFFRYIGMLATTLPDWSETSASEVIWVMKRNLEEKGLLLTAAIPRGGCISLVKPMAEKVREEGGVVHVGATVEEVIVKEGEVKGVSIQETMEGAPQALEGMLVGEVKTVEAPIVCAVPLWSLEDIVPFDELPSWFTRRVRSIRGETTAGVGYTLAVDGELWSDRKFRSSLSLPRTRLPFQCYAVSNFDRDAAPRGKSLITLGCPADPELALDKRRVRAKLEDLWDDLRQMFPDLEERLEWVLQASYVGIDGLARKPGLVGRFKPDVKAPEVKGLYFAGDTYRGRGIGMEAAADSALRCAARILSDLGIRA